MGFDAMGWRITPRPSLPLALLVGISDPAVAQTRAAPPSPVISVAFTYTGDAVATVRGGLRRDLVVLDNVDITAAIDLDQLAGWHGGSVFLYGLGNQGGNPSSVVGDVQGVDNIEAPTSWRLYEAWFEQRLLDARLTVLAGLYDMNSEFDVLPSAALFVNSSFGLGPELALSRPQGPSTFPVTALGVRVRSVPHQSVYVQGAVLDGVPGDPDEPGGTRVRFDANDGALLVGEAGVFFGGPGVDTQRDRLRRARRRRVSRLSEARYRAKLAAGIWGYTARFPRIAGGAGGETQRGSRGWYLGGEWLVLPRAGHWSRGLWVVGRIGFGDERVNRFAGYTGGALVYRGMVASRPADEIGVGVAAVHNGDRFIDAERSSGRAVVRSEIVFEAAYQLSLSTHFVIAPSVQFVRTPNSDPTVDDAVVVILRTQVSF